VARFARAPRGLQTLFPASSPSPHAPDNLVDEVQLVTVWPGKAPSFERIERVQAVSASVVTPTLTALTAGDEEWIEILYGDLSHDSATARTLQMRLNLAAQNFFVARWTNMLTAYTIGQISGFEPLFAGPGTPSGASQERLQPRTPLYLGPDTALVVGGDTAAAAYAITLALLFVRHPFPEAPLLL